MKKLVFMFVAAATMSFAVSFSSCGGANTAADSAATDSDSIVVVDTVAQDTAAADSAATDSAATAATDSVKA